jgi:hypothetical protein
LIKKAPPSFAYLDVAHTLLHSHGKEGFDKINKLEELFRLNPNTRISQELLKLMCKATSAPKDIEEEELLHRRKEVETTLFEFQSYFLQNKVFHSYRHFLETSTLVPTVYIKVYQEKKYQAFCE